MADISTAGLCRITVRSPERSMDLAVPADVPVADLLPTVLRYAGAETEENGLDHGGWALQRLGEAPLDEEATLATADLTDGEVLYLRPRTDKLPEVQLDDLVDGIASTMRGRHGWGERAVGLLLRGLLAVALTLTLAVLAWPGAGSELRAAVVALAGLLLLAVAATASRAMGDTASGAVLGAAVGPYLAVAGWLLPGGQITGAGAHEVFGAKLLAAGAAAGGGAVLALAAVALFTPLFTGVLLGALAAATCGALMSFAGLDPDGAATAVAAVGVAVGAFVPTLAFKLAGLRMPFLPSTPAELQQDIEPYAGQTVAVRTALADIWMTALYTTTAVVALACTALLAYHPDTAEAVTAVVLCLLLLLHGRGLNSVPQRLALVSAAACGLAMLTLAAGHSLGDAGRLVLGGSALALCAALAVAASTLPGRRLSPYWGRAAELLHSALALALLPLTLWVLGVFGALRGMNG
ncbi:type VII secretion integral membrane protein EccD [Streptomyces sp. NPDC056716]|uniref:type VII secretion integral membrane protein EccD n=1 Tax=unclassified Streptomyces TaxID=2593676 RepID=UPI0036AE551F